MNLRVDTDLIKMLDTEPNAAMEELVEQYTALVWHIAAKYLLNTEDIKECVNDTFAEVYEHRAEYDETKGSLAVWIGTIAKHRAISMYRKLRKTDVQNMEEVADESDRITEAEESIDIEEALSKLSDTDREIIRMKYYEGMSISEIAESLHIPYDAARKRHKRSVMNLKKLLILTLAIIAALALVACGIVYVYHHFRMIPGYGITTEETPASFVLPEPVVVQKGMFTVELVDAALYDDTLRYEYKVTMPEIETHTQLPTYGEEGWTPGQIGPDLTIVPGYFYKADGTRLESVRIEEIIKGIFENTKYYVNEARKHTLVERDVKRFREMDEVKLTMCFASAFFDGKDYGEIKVPFTLKKIPVEEIEAYPKIYDKDMGGIMVDNSLAGDTLSLDVYPLAGEEREYYSGLTEDIFWRVEGDAPVTIQDAEGRIYKADEQYLTPWLQEDVVTYTFHGITPGTYTLSLPYVYLLAKGENTQSMYLNFADCTFEDKEFRIPGGTLKVTGIREIDPLPIEDFYARKWEITAHCEFDDETQKTVVLPYSLDPEWQPGGEELWKKENGTTGNESYFMNLNEETDEAVWYFGWRAEADPYQDFSKVKLRLAQSQEYYCIRYTHPLELEFEVK